MPWLEILLAGMVALVTGLDRTALMQIMISRPIVAAPLTGLVLGDLPAGLAVGFLAELLWLTRIPVGAAIPPDDTQVAVGTTTLVVVCGSLWGYSGPGFVVLALLVAMPLGKAGQWLDHLARSQNSRLQKRAEQTLASGNGEQLELIHWQGVGHFAFAAVMTYLFIISFGAVALYFLAPAFLGTLSESAGWLQLVFPLTGVAVILSSMHVSRTLTLFCASFSTAMLMLWLV
jgi:mannose/fructose/N-acetylgalactosamine-specific phosphotransferase system component IIC